MKQLQHIPVMSRLSMIVKYVMISCLLSVPFALHAQEEFRQMQDQSIFQELARKISEDTQTIRCEFTQEKHMSFMEKPVISKGRFYYSSDNKLRWEYTEPFSYVILMRGDQLTIIDEGMRSDLEMAEHPAFKKVQKLLSTVLRGDIFAAESEFSMQFLENSTAYKIELTPKQNEILQFISSMDIYFDKADMMMSTFELHEQGGDTTHTEFTARKINTTLPSGIFEPQGH